MLISGINSGVIIYNCKFTSDSTLGFDLEDDPRLIFFNLNLYFLNRKTRENICSKTYSVNTIESAYFMTSKVRLIVDHIE